MPQSQSTSVTSRQGTESSDDHDKCYLTSMPPEIRNYIYELAFTPDSKDKNFLTAKPPSKALCLTSRAIYHDTGPMYCRIYRTYWETTPFELRVNEFCRAGSARQELNNTLLQLNRNAVAHITSLGVHNEEYCYTFTTEGVWRGTTFGGNPISHGEYFLVPKKLESVLRKAGYGVLTPAAVRDFKMVSNWELSFEPSILEDVKRVGGKVALTKGEIMAMVEWLTDGAIYKGDEAIGSFIAE